VENRIPYEKLSKRKRKEMDQRRRKGWGEVSPVTRRSENPKAYNRQKARRWEQNSEAGPFSMPPAA